MTSAAVFRSELTLVFTDRRSLWWHAAVCAAGPLLLVLLWPMEDLSHFLRSAEGPGTLRMVGVALGLGLNFLAGGFVLDQLPEKRGHAFVHWLRYTPTGPGAFLAGRLLFHLVHSGLLSLLILPSLAVAAIPSRARPGETLALVLFVFFTSFCLRAAAEGGRRGDRRSGTGAYLLFFLLFLSGLLFSHTGLRDWSLISAYLTLSEPARSDFRPVWKSGILLSLAALAGTALSWWRLRLARRVELAEKGR